MTLWPNMKVGRVARLISGVGFPHQYQGKTSGAYPFLKVSDLASAVSGYHLVTAQNWVSQTDLASLGARLAPKGAIVFPKVGAAMLKNPRRLVNLPAAMDNNLMAVVPNSGEPRFWLYALSTIDLGEISAGGVLPYVTEGQIRDLHIPFPSVEQQRRIADFLDAETANLDLMAEKRQAQLTLLRQKRFNMVREVLAQGLRGTAQRPTQLGWLPRIPADWELTPLRYLVECLDGQRVPLSAQERSTRQGPYPYHGASRVVDHVDDYLFDEPLVLLGEDGAQLANPNLEVSFYVEGKIWVNNHAHVLRPRGIDGQLLAEILNVFDRNLYMSGATREKITQDEMNRILLPVPPDDQQYELLEWITDRHQKRERLESTLLRQLGLLSERRQALITAAVTGQFDVSTASGRNVTEGVSA
ncbi:restriction endonuclease subunit S [Streptomyces sp. NPDC057052]|uniref:restriction endonuclease subunit S n=1 Tax=Streptomyces sp. NPDC057052 TaxID=3346010 RepID=UPI003635864B